jgi:hypothetical protein
MGYLTLWGHLGVRDPPGGFIKEFLLPETSRRIFAIKELTSTRNLPEDYYRPENAHF